MFSIILLISYLFAQENHQYLRKIDLEGFRNYVYSYRAPVGDAPTVLVIPGGPGPGSTSIDKRYSFFPSEFGIIKIDHRGVGRNQAILDEYSSRIFVEDIFQVLKAVAPQKYYIYAVSYGTIVGTMLAHKIEQGGFLRPQAIVFEGTFSRAFRSLSEQTARKLRDWQNYKNSLRPEELAFLESAETPLRLNAQKWGSAIGMFLNIGRSPNYLSYYMNQLFSSEDKSQLIALVNSISTDDDLDIYSKTMWKSVVCSEMQENNLAIANDFKLEYGELIPREMNQCADVPLSRPYHVKKYPLKHTPIFYFARRTDVSTPYWHSLIHYRFQKKANAHVNLIEVPKGGHNALSVNLARCAKKLWSSLENLEAFNQELKLCAPKAYLH